MAGFCPTKSAINESVTEVPYGTSRPMRSGGSSHTIVTTDFVLCRSWVSVAMVIVSGPTPKTLRPRMINPRPYSWRRTSGRAGKIASPFIRCQQDYSATRVAAVNRVCGTSRRLQAVCSRWVHPATKACQYLLPFFGAVMLSVLEPALS